LAADLGARAALVLAGMAAEGTAHIEEIFGVNLQQAMQVHKRKASAQTYEKAKLKVSRGLQQQQEFVTKLKLGRFMIQNIYVSFSFSFLSFSVSRYDLHSIRAREDF
jgi:hypothetical protein